MKVLEKGHVYLAAHRHPKGPAVPADGDQHSTLTFVNKQPGQEHPGTTTQEVLRILIDRTRHCNNCQPHRNNEQAIYHLRMALVLHEARALERKTEKGDFMPEYLVTGDDGHFDLKERVPAELDTPYLEPHRNDWDRPCNHPAAPKKG